MNHTSTNVPMWQIDCEEFQKIGRPFHLRNVTTDEHERFLEAFAKKHNFRFNPDETTAPPRPLQASLQQRASTSAGMFSVQLSGKIRV